MVKKIGFLVLALGIGATNLQNVYASKIFIEPLINIGNGQVVSPKTSSIGDHTPKFGYMLFGSNIMLGASLGNKFAALDAGYNFLYFFEKDDYKSRLRSNITFGATGGTNINLIMPLRIFLGFNFIDQLKAPDFPKATLKGMSAKAGAGFDLWKNLKLNLIYSYHWYSKLARDGETESFPIVGYGYENKKPTRHNMHLAFSYPFTL